MSLQLGLIILAQGVDARTISTPGCLNGHWHVHITIVHLYHTCVLSGLGEAVGYILPPVPTVQAHRCLAHSLLTREADVLTLHPTPAAALFHVLEFSCHIFLIRQQVPCSGRPGACICVKAAGVGHVWEKGSTGGYAHPLLLLSV